MWPAGRTLPRPALNAVFNVDLNILVLFCLHRAQFLYRPSKCRPKQFHPDFWSNVFAHCYHAIILLGFDDVISKSFFLRIFVLLLSAFKSSSNIFHFLISPCYPHLYLTAQFNSITSSDPKKSLLSFKVNISANT